MNGMLTEFQVKIITGTKGAYEYYDVPVNNDITLGNGQSEYTVNANAGEELFVIIVSTPEALRGHTGKRFKYTYAIQQDGEILAVDDVIANKKINGSCTPILRTVDSQLTCNRTTQKKFNWKLLI